MTYENHLNFAKQQDAEDALARFRSEFYFPEHQGKPVIYFCGNSLGLQPKGVEAAVLLELDDWKKWGVEGHFHSTHPWYHYHTFLTDMAAKLVGAKPLEVVVMNSLTVNLHLLMVSFYRPQGKRIKLLMEGGAFPSDQYAVESQARMHGLDPAEVIVELSPRPGEHTLRTADITAKIAELGDELALVLFGGVNYYTGQFFDLEAITKAAHGVGAFAGFDLAHAAGNLPLSLHDWGADFATWCTYKYLNSGPGGTSGVFVHERHAHSPELVRMAGWWGHDDQERFLMRKGFKPMPGAAGWQLSNAQILPMAAHKAALELLQAAGGMEALRAKSLKLTGYAEYLIGELNRKKGQLISIITPAEPAARGCQLSLVFAKEGKRYHQQLTEAGVVADWREPNVIRIAPVPLYNSFEEVYRFYELLSQMA